MFEKFFTVYTGIEPPEIYKDDPDLILKDTEQFNSNIDPMVVAVDNTLTDIFSEYPGIVNPFENNKPVENNPPLDNIIIENNHMDKKVQSVTIEGSKQFEEAFLKAVQINPEVEKYRNFLVKTAKVESTFNPKAVAVTGRHYGWFLMGIPEIKATTGMTPQLFINDPVKQILGAVKLYKSKLAIMKNNGAYNLGISKNYSEDALVAGAWLGGEGNVLKFLKGQGDASDSHLYTKVGKKGGTSVGRRMKEFNYGMGI